MDRQTFDINWWVKHLGRLSRTPLPWKILNRRRFFLFFYGRRKIFPLCHLFFLWFFFNLLCTLRSLNLVFGGLQRLNWGGLALIENQRGISWLSVAWGCPHNVLIAERKCYPTCHCAIRNSGSHYINTIDWSCKLIFRNSACRPVWIEGLNDMFRVLLSQGG